MKWSSQKTIMFQVGIIKACSKQENCGTEELDKRITVLEDKINKGIPTNEVKSTQTIEIKTEKNIEKSAQNRGGESVKKENTANNISTEKELPYWKNVVNTLKESGKVMLYTNLINSTASQINDMTIGIKFANGLTNFGKSVLERPENMQELVRLVSVEAGKEMRIKYLDGKEETKVEKQDKFSGLDIPINIIEE